MPRAGDFDGDGFDDLAIGVPGEGLDDGNKRRESFRSSSAARGDHHGEKPPLHRRSAAASRTFDNFGYTLATGDFDGDGFVDLASANRARTFRQRAGAGNVVEVFGAAGGLDLSRAALRPGFGARRRNRRGERPVRLRAGCRDFDKDGPPTSPSARPARPSSVPTTARSRC